MGREVKEERLKIIFSEERNRIGKEMEEQRGKEWKGNARQGEGNGLEDNYLH